MPLYLGLVFSTVRKTGSPRRDPLWENLALRQQLAVYRRQTYRPRLRQRDRLFWTVLARGWWGWRDALVFVRPETVIRWDRARWRRYWTWRSRGRRPGRPRISREVQALIRQLVQENPRWGAARLVGELQALGHDLSIRTVRRYRHAVRRRPPSQRWRTFLRNHSPHIWATDLFTVQTVTFRTLYVLVVISHDRRRIEHWNVTHHPRAAWIWQQVREATAWGHKPQFLIRDRDRCFGTDFVARAEGIGIATILTPVRAPNANAIAERVIGTLRRECLDHLIVINERHLRRVLGEYIQHYNAMRPHRSLDLDAPEGRPRTARFPGAQLRRRAVLGGLHHEYWWAA
ncbi:MAG TPA: integrase core domain-containing protein [Dehalococcoidia bacterium]|nr:integrase core domain-containing protein [Dehalococcoidia bacterium]